MKRIFCILIAIWTIWILPAQDYDGWIEKAMNAVEKDSLYEAEKYFKNALNTDPANMRNAMLLSNLGTIQRRMGKNKEAIESYTLAINKSPHSVTMLLNRASLYLEMDHLDKAYSDYCNVIDLDRRNIEALQFRAYIYMRRRQYPEAKADYRSLLEEEPGNKTARVGLVMVNQKEHRYREALDALNLLVTDYPKDASLLKARAEIEVEMNTLDLALLDLENAARITPHDADIYVMCGDIYMAQGKKREAYVAYEKAVDLGIPRPQLQDKLKASKK
ncbi:MAG: tetratricopeptide repeat protein [Bacteroides sp.]|nr:tetratricopeptide repeat protein [Bacteroides sp.]